MNNLKWILAVARNDYEDRLTECSSVEEYGNELMTTSHKLTEVGFAVDDTWLACLLLMGLPESYEPMIMGLEASGTRITADAVKAKILQDVKIGGISAGGSKEEDFYSKKKAAGSKKKTDKSKIQCYRCKQFGHFASECQQKGPKNKKEKSGATSHMYSSKAFLLNVQETSQRVSVANDAELSVVATGSVELEADIGKESCDLTMSDVLCVPDIAINLLSVSRMCSKGYSVQFTKETCEVRRPFNNEGTRETEVLQLVHSDLCGPMEEESIGGSKYFLSFIDDASRKLVVYFLQSKTEVLECFKEYKALMENQTGKRIKGLRTDNGTEYVNTGMKRFLRSCGIRHEMTVPYNLEQNGLAKRMNRTVVEKARCLLLDADLDKSFWAEATAMATFLVNRSPTKSVPVTPEERFTGKRPDLSELRVFGAKVMCYIPKQRKRKWDAKSKPGIFVGLSSVPAKDENGESRS
ncbi:uncharacterized protein LOC135712243 [Ochlerotatus camptorhynchus]|uniref:uncharacterized protein LOC135712243 n=1 Tax=Ochlerotatus camptorhynchus TaxID=644619 RepID=UPI0031D76879